MKAVLVCIADEWADAPKEWAGHRLHTVSVVVQFDGEAMPRTAERLIAGALRRGGLKKARR